MKKQDALKRHEFLVRELERHNKLYYQESQPEISDSDYDSLMLEARELEEQFPELKREGLVTGRVGGEAGQAFDEVPHDPPMLSLGNIFSLGDLHEFHNRCIQAAGEDVLYTAELKYDGLAVDIQYVNGKLVTGSTRGNGLVGENITGNIKTISSLPHNLEGGQVPKRLSVRGEVFLNHQEFERINHERESRGEKIFANPRNAASGSLRQLDVSVTAGRNLDLVLYAVGSVEPDPGLESHRDMIEYLSSLGLPVSTVSETGGIEAITGFYQYWEENRFSLGHDIDGIVIKIDNLQSRQRVGQTSRVPRWAVAWKFPAEEGVTEFLSMEVQVGRTGVVTPVANLKPVTIGGVVVKRATLHNFHEIKRLGAAPGDLVSIIRAGEVIPKITGVVKKGAGYLPDEPESCPACGSPLSREEVYFRCENSLCPAVIFEQLKFFISKDGMDLEFFGPELLLRLHEKGTVTTFADFYRLSMEDLMSVERMGEKSAARVLESISRRRRVSLDHFLRSLGIRNTGQYVAQKLAVAFHSLDRLRKATVNEMESVHEVGPEVAGAVYRFFHDDATSDMVDQMLRAGLEVEDVEAAAGSALFEGLTFVFTGTLPTMKRDQAEELVKQLGGRASSSVSKKTSYVVAGEAAGSKEQKALELGVPVITEEEFLRMVNND